MDHRYQRLLAYRLDHFGMAVADRANLLLAIVGMRQVINPAERRIETAYIAAVRHVASTAGANQDFDTSAAFNRIYPDDIRPTRKEVGPAATTVRASEAS